MKDGETSIPVQTEDRHSRNHQVGKTVTVSIPDCGENIQVMTPEKKKCQLDEEDNLQVGYKTVISESVRKSDRQRRPPNRLGFD